MSILQFNDLFTSVHEEEDIILDYVSGRETLPSIAEKKGVIKGADFNRALFSIWLGAESVGEIEGRICVEINGRNGIWPNRSLLYPNPVFSPVPERSYRHRRGPDYRIFLPHQ